MAMNQFYLKKASEKIKKLCTKVDWFLLKAQAFVGYSAFRQVLWNKNNYFYHYFYSIASDEVSSNSVFSSVQFIFFVLKNEKYVNILYKCDKNFLKAQ